MTFKPEIGKRHVMRGGEITDVVKYDERTGCLYTGENFSELKEFWYPTGVYNLVYPNENDLIAANEEPKYYWMNVYPDGRHLFHASQKEADSALDKYIGGKTIKLKSVKDDE